MSIDPEINALHNVYEALKGLNTPQIKRIIDWVTSKFHLNEEGREVQPEVIEAAEPVMVEPVEPPVEPVKKRRGRKPRKVKSTVEKPTGKLAVATGIKHFMKYDTFEDLLFSSTVRTITAKILLAAAYLQEKKNYKELSSYDISSSLKKIGEEVNNPSAAINSLMTKKPPLMLQTGKQGDSSRSRRKFRVTEEGLRIARNYINE